MLFPGEFTASREYYKIATQLLILLPIGISLSFVFMRSNSLLSFSGVWSAPGVHFTHMINSIGSPTIMVYQDCHLRTDLGIRTVFH